MKNLFHYLEENGIILTRHSKKFPLHSLQEIMENHLKYMIPRNEVRFFIRRFYQEMHRNKLGIEIPILGNSSFIVSKELFPYFYSLKIRKTKHNTLLKKLPFNEYTKFEREIYNFILTQKVTPQKSIQYFFDLTTHNDKLELEKTLKILNQNFWILKVGSDYEQGNLWKPASLFDKKLTKKALMLKREEALETVIFYVIKNSNGITRPLIKKIFKNFAQGEEIDQTITRLILNHRVAIHKTLIINGKKALVVV